MLRTQLIEKHTRRPRFNPRDSINQIAWHRRHLGFEPRRKPFKVFLATSLGTAEVHETQNQGQSKGEKHSITVPSALSSKVSVSSNCSRCHHLRRTPSRPPHAPVTHLSSSTKFPSSLRTITIMELITVPLFH